MTYRMSYAKWIPSLTEDLMLWMGSHPALTYASFVYYLSPWRETVGGKHGGEGFVSCTLCCLEASTLSHLSVLGHREDLQSAFLWVRKF